MHPIVAKHRQGQTVVIEVKDGHISVTDYDDKSLLVQRPVFGFEQTLWDYIKAMQK